MRAEAMSPTNSLQYPQRFHAAAFFFEKALPDDAPIDDETRLILYALRQQAVHGACKEPRPSRWNFVESAKWQAWQHLAQMSSFEAMHLYVRTLEQLYPNWWEDIATDYRSAPLDADIPVEAPAAKPLPTTPIPTSPSQEIASSANMAPAPTQPALPANGPPPPPTPPAVTSPQRPPPLLLRQPSSPNPAPLAEQVPDPNTWTQISFPPGTPLPPPRYEHAAALHASQLYVFNGTGTGARYLHDTWILDLPTLTWSNANISPLNSAPQTPASVLPTSPPTPHPAPRFLPPCSGHTALPYASSLLLLGGRVHRKYTTEHLQLWQLDPPNPVPHPLPTIGPIPKALTGHTATIIHDRLYIFGGEDTQRRPLGNLHILNLHTMAWIECPHPSGPTPPARSGHTATPFLNRYIVIFGGSAGALCYSDVWALDTVTLTWQQLAVAGKKLAPRAGHAAVLAGDSWYIVGGGNNQSGCTDMVALSLAEFRQWHQEHHQRQQQQQQQQQQGPVGGAEDGADAGIVPLALTPRGARLGKRAVVSVTWDALGSLPRASALASEGLSLLLARLKGVRYLVAFGGYNGEYHNAVSVLRLEGADGADVDELEADLEAARKEVESARKLASAAQQEAAVAKDTVVLLRQQVTSLQSELEQVEARLSVSQQQLAATQARSEQLEDFVAALQQRVTELEAALAAAGVEVPGAAGSGGRNGVGAGIEDASAAAGSEDGAGGANGVVGEGEPAMKRAASSSLWRFFGA